MLSLPLFASGVKADTESDTLVVYFSRTGEQYNVGVIDKGNTAIVAEMIAEETGADLFEILPEEDYYPDTYDALTDVAKQEQNENARPAYKGDVPDLSGYSTVFIGAPVWWGDWPMILYTFFEKEDLSGKTLIPFSTHEGSGLAGFALTMAEAAEALGVHPSTVSRTVKNKYLQCSRGVFPLRYFFEKKASAPGGTAMGSRAIKERLKRCISDEDPQNPLSDREITERLMAEGCVISRRTVAKYREELQIPGRAERRQP